MSFARTLTTLSLFLALTTWVLGCPPPPPEELLDDDDDAGDDDAGDDDAGDDDAGDDDSGDDDADASIYDLQGGSVPDQTVVRLPDVVVTSPVGPYTTGFFVQELGSEANPQYSGIWIYIDDAGAAKQLLGQVSVNDRVEVTGLFQEYYGNSEVKITTAGAVQVLGTGTVAPTPVSACTVATGGNQLEAFQGVLVTISAPSVTDANPDAPKDFGEFEVDGCLRVDDVFYDHSPALNTSFTSITGPMFYSYSNAKLEPRTAADVVP